MDHDTELATACAILWPHGMDLTDYGDGHIHIDHLQIGFALDVYPARQVIERPRKGTGPQCPRLRFELGCRWNMVDVANALVAAMQRAQRCG